MSCAEAVRNRISPIQMKSGSAVSVQLDDEPQIVTAIASPAGRDAEQLHADPGDARQRQADPDAAAEDQEQRDDQQRGDRRASSHCAAPPRRASRARALAAQLEHQLVDEGDRQHHACRAPSSSCGIQSGVASLLVEMSWKACDCHASRTL